MCEFIKKSKYIILILLMICASFSSVFFADGDVVLDDGAYLIDAELRGGTGRVSIETPISFEVVDGEIKLKIVWSSGYYDFMKIGDTIVLPSEQTDEATMFFITVKSLEQLDFTAQTSKMSSPHEIEYSIVFDASGITRAEGDGGADGRSMESLTGAALWITALLAAVVVAVIFFFSKRRKNTTMMFVLAVLIAPLALTACADAKVNAGETQNYTYAEKPSIGLEWVGREELGYAKGFAIDYYDGGVTLVRVRDSSFLILPNNFTEQNDAKDRIKISGELAKNLVTLERPSRLYLAATSVMAFMHDIDEMGSIMFTGTKGDSWGLEYVREALENGEIRFAGRYSAPDYETLVKSGCDFSVFSTMITHAPDVADKMREVGIPVFVDYSSYEAHPLGRTEWIKVYGAIFGKSDVARTVFDEQDALLRSAETLEKTDVEVAFFSISASNKISARKSEDYVAKMIEIAGGEYAYKSVDDAVVSALAINMERETFFRETADSDIIIYNTTISGGFGSISELTNTHPLLADLDAVKNGDVWITTDAFYQSTTSHGIMVTELAEIIRNGKKICAAEAGEKFLFFQKLE